MPWLSLLDVAYIGISPYHTICRGFHCQTSWYQSNSHPMPRFSLADVYIQVSVYITLCAVAFTVRLDVFYYQIIGDYSAECDIHLSRIYNTPVARGHDVDWK